MASMTPEQRTGMEKSLANSGMSGKSQYCVTPEQVAKGMDVESFKKKMESSQKTAKLTLSLPAKKVANSMRFATCKMVPRRMPLANTSSRAIKNGLTTWSVMASWLRELYLVHQQVKCTQISKPTPDGKAVIVAASNL